MLSQHSEKGVKFGSTPQQGQSEFSSIACSSGLRFVRFFRFPTFVESWG
jgi:hypothetical protein